MKIQIAKIPTLSLSELPLLSEANIFQNDPVVWLHYNISPTSNSLKSGVILRSGQKKTIQNIIAPLFSGKDTSPSPKKKSTKNGRTPPSLDVWIAPRNSRPLEVLLRCQYSLFGAKRGRKRGRKKTKTYPRFDGLGFICFVWHPCFFSSTCSPEENAKHEIMIDGKRPKFSRRSEGVLKQRLKY